MPALFPTDPSQGKAQTTRSTAVRFPKSWQFDVDAGDLVTDQAGRVSEVDGTEAYRQWALKALITPRYSHPVYDRQYGSELEALRRQSLPASVLQSEVTRTITETLMADPLRRTKSVGAFVFERTGTALTVTCTVTLNSGDSLTMTVPAGGMNL